MKKLLFALLLIPFFTFSQENIKFIEVVGEASKLIQPDYITAEVFISSSLYYDSYNEKELSKFENSMRKAAAKLQVEKYLMHENQFLGACTSFEKSFMLKFDNIEDYERVMQLANDADYSDLYVDFYLEDYKVSDEKKKAAADALFTEALLNAQKKAELASTTLSFTLGSVLSVEENDSYYDDYYDSYYDDYDYDYSPEAIEVSKSFYVRFEIE